MDGKKLLIQMEMSKPALPKALHEGLKGTDVFLQSAHFCSKVSLGWPIVHVEESGLNICVCNFVYQCISVFFSRIVHIFFVKSLDTTDELVVAMSKAMWKGLATVSSQTGLFILNHPPSRLSH